MPGRAHSHRAVLERLRLAEQSGVPVLLAVVVSTAGSTYRKPGALVLVEADGRQTGVISGGCLEAEFHAAALRSLGVAAPAWMDVDSLDDADLLFGTGSGCRGRSRILLWPLSPAAPEWALLRGLLTPGAGCCWLEIDPLAAVPQPRWHAQPPDEQDAGRLLLTLHPPPRIWIVGAGPELSPLLSWLRQAGWCCVVSEHRQAWREAQDLTLADRVCPQRPTVLAAEVLPVTALLCLSHSAEIDLAALRMAAAQAPAQIAAIGLLGPPRRRDELLAQLGPDAVAALQPRLVAPVGLPLGGEGPLAIALAIAAWLQQRFQVR